jgi:hypothetical protein
MDKTKNALGHITPNLCFRIRWDVRVAWCIPVRLGCEISMHYFSCSGGPEVVSIKSAQGHVTQNFSFCIPWDL